MIPLRWSHLRHLGRSPAHYRYHLDNPVTETDAMRVGSRVHDLVLHGDRNRFAVWEGGRRAGKEWDLFALAHAEATILTADQEDRAQNIADAVKGCDLAMAAFFACVTEERRAWTVADRECEGTPDAVGAASIAELKVTRDCSPNRFPWHAQRMGWLAQVSWYNYGCFRGGATNLTIVAVEDQPPHVVTVYRLSPDAAELGSRTWRSHFERLLVCEAEDRWPGYTEAVADLDVDSEFTIHHQGEELTIE